MKPYQQRVVAERSDLNNRTKKLALFLMNKELMDRLPFDETVRLLRQYTVMCEYSSILNDRIDNFKEENGN